MQTTTSVYDFDTQLSWSAGYLDGGIETVLCARIPGCYDVVKADEKDDRNGTDYWAMRQDLPPLSIDVKVRKDDYAAHPNPQRRSDDLALETWSVTHTKVGWTRDTTKRTDYVLWYWTQTGRFFLTPFPPLCKTFLRYWKTWRDQYGSHTQTSNGWQSECVFVPRQVVIEKMDAWQCGTVPQNGNGHK